MKLTFKKRTRQSEGMVGLEITRGEGPLDVEVAVDVEPLETQPLPAVEAGEASYSDGEAELPEDATIPSLESGEDDDIEVSGVDGERKQTTTILHPTSSDEMHLRIESDLIENSNLEILGWYKIALHNGSLVYRNDSDLPGSGSVIDEFRVERKNENGIVRLPVPDGESFSAGDTVVVSLKSNGSIRVDSQPSEMMGEEEETSSWLDAVPNSNSSVFNPDSDRWGFCSSRQKVATNGSTQAVQVNAVSHMKSSEVGECGEAYVHSDGDCIVYSSESDLGVDCWTYDGVKSTISTSGGAWTIPSSCPALDDEVDNLRVYTNDRDVLLEMV